ncbi:hypothetical protein [Deinococcus alpinitundrae]|uniref:hypothetical protein n=1 Tax=Deinococcus alpinitundrae TaxID=468913 RepID=UPI00137A7FDA|nr:hypothetical protein [Deinococcus alpinitundrae]
MDPWTEIELTDPETTIHHGNRQMDIKVAVLGRGDGPKLIAAIGKGVIITTENRGGGRGLLKYGPTMDRFIVDES